MSKLEVISLTLVDLVKTPLLIMLFLYSHQHEAKFHQRYQNFESLFHELVNSVYSVFREGLLFFILITQTLTNII